MAAAQANIRQQVSFVVETLMNKAVQPPVPPHGIVLCKHTALHQWPRPNFVHLKKKMGRSEYSRLHKQTESASQSRASSLALPPCFWTCLSTSGKAMPCSATTARRRDGPVSFGAGLKRGSAPSRSLRVEVYLFSVKNDFPLEVQARTYVFRKSPIGDSFTPICIVAPLLSSLQPLT